MTAPVINTPRGSITTTGSKTAVLTWDPKFQSKHQGHFTKAQKFVDSEILRLTEKYIPLLTGTLIKTGILGTVIGSGEVKWIAPYARFQYYASRVPGSFTGPLRGPQWFQRMKEVSGKRIVASARKIAKGGSK